MSSSTRRLGDMVSAFRRRVRLTQQEIADHLGPPVNRSLVAHLEQGRRLPSSDVLMRMCKFLEIPEDVWRPFLSIGFQRARTSAFPRGVRLRPFQQLVVCGNNGSGKTTLARALARALSIPCLPFTSHGRTYLPDLSSNPARWAFETQVAFITEKAIQLRQSLERGQPVVVERSLSEDLHIYARYFVESGAMDKRSGETFRAIAEHLLDELPEPDLAIYCTCPVSIALERVHSRNRDDVAFQLHSRERLERLDALYTTWHAHHSPSNLYQLDAAMFDWRDPVVMEQIFHDVEALLEEDSSTEQLPLFQQLPTTKSHPACNMLVATNPRIFSPRPESKSSKVVFGSGARIAPRAYIAAPFTSIASSTTLTTPNSLPISRSLFPEQPPHGMIPKGGYRAALLGIERTLATWGLASIIPHRDVNEWGLRTLTPAEAMQGCTDHVHGCDLFVGIMGNSCGSHYEFGVALGIGRPCIILTPRNMPSSFLAQGVASLDSANLLTVSFDNLDDAGKSLSTDRVRDFIFAT